MNLSDMLNTSDFQIWYSERTDIQGRILAGENPDTPLTHADVLEIWREYVQYTIWFTTPGDEADAILNEIDYKEAYLSGLGTLDDDI